MATGFVRGSDYRVGFSAGYGTFQAQELAFDN